MGIQDLIITPIYIILLSMLAFLIRPYVTTAETRKFFMPALMIRFSGAIMLGVIYQFYYGGGDTFNYFTYGSRWIWEAFMDDPATGISLLMEHGGERVPATYKYSQNIWFYRDVHSFFVVRITAFFDILTGHTYSATALFFATFSFSGLWAMYSVLAKKYPGNEKWLAIAILFVPTVVFWGSGILKDTITLGALAWITYCLVVIIDFNEFKWYLIFILLFSAFMIYSIKIYIIICFAPTVFVWLYWKYQSQIRSTMLKLIIAPFLLTIFGGAGFLALQQISSMSDKYSLDNVAERARITAYDIRYGWGARTGGDGGYDIGIPDGTFAGMLKLMPAAINVSLFRPYLWEVKNPLMLLSAVESVIMLILTFYFLIWKKGIVNVFSDPFLVFCFSFALIFAFAVGVSTANFGTLMRYKIPLMGFYGIMLKLSVKTLRD